MLHDDADGPDLGAIQLAGWDPPKLIQPDPSDPRFAADPEAGGFPVRHFEIDSLAVDARVRLDPERSLAADVRSSGGGSSGGFSGGGFSGGGFGSNLVPLLGC